MLDPFVILAPFLLLPVIGLLRFIGCVGADPVPVEQHTLVVTPPAVNLQPGQSQQFVALLDGSPSANITWSPNAPVGLFQAPANFVPGTELVTAQSQWFPSTQPGKAIVTRIGTAANFVNTDLKTQGKWKDKYGKDGWAFAYAPSNLVHPPPYLTGLTEVVGDQAVSEVIDPIPDPRGLLNPTTFANFVAYWIGADGIDLEFKFTDILAHRVSFYCVDWDIAPNATQTMKMFDNSKKPPALLDSQVLTGFGEGRYLVWELSGNILLQIRSNGELAVLEGIFFD